MESKDQKVGILNRYILEETRPQEISYELDNHQNLYVDETIDYADSVNYLHFKNCTFEKFNFQRGNIGIVKFENCEIQDLTVYDTNMMIELESCIVTKFRTGFGVERFNVSKCVISNCKIEELWPWHSKSILINDNHKVENITCRNVEFLRIKNQNNPNIKISLSSVQELHLSHQKIKSLGIYSSPSLKGNLELSNIISLTIEKCDLRDIVIAHSNFNTIKEFDLLTSDYDGIKINELAYPKQLIDRNTHRLLKRIAVQNNDLINGKLQGIQELICYRKELWKEKNYFSWFPLWAGYVTNKNGSSIKRAFISWLMISLIFFVAASSFYSEPLLNQILSGRFFIFSLNPTHSLESVFPEVSRERFEPVILSLDYIGRVAIGFVLFQIISAFRFFFKNN